MNTHALLRALAKDALNRPFSLNREWSVQGLGMMRLYLSPEIRLHIWHSSLRVPNVTDIHTHPWSFRSYVVAGHVQQVRFVADEPLAILTPGSEPYTEHYRKQQIQCGVGARVLGEPVGVWLRPLRSENYVEGQFYEQEWSEIHRSAPTDGTVTLVERAFRKDTEHAWVYFKTPEWVDAKPRAATMQEVARVTKAALEKL